MISPKAVLAVLPFMLLACGPSQEWGGTVVEEAGVVRIENPAEPLAGPGSVSVELLWTASSPEEGDIWEAPRRLHVGDSVIYLLDRQASRIHRVSLQGDLLGSLGEMGQGPGQYGRLVDAIPVHVGLFVVDAGNGRVEVLAPGGEIRASVALDQYVFSALPLGREAIVVFGALGRGHGWQRIDSRGNITSFAFPELETGNASEPPPSREATWGDRLVRMELTVPRFWAYSSSGVLERMVHIPFSPEEADEGKLQAMAQEIADVMAEDGIPAGVIRQQVDAMKARYRINPRFRDIRFDDGSGLTAILEQDPEDFGAGPATLHLLSLEGVYLGTLPFNRPWADFDLRDGCLYVLARDPLTDLVTLQVYALVVPEGLLDRARELTS